MIFLNTGCLFRAFYIPNPTICVCEITGDGESSDDLSTESCASCIRRSPDITQRNWMTDDVGKIENICRANRFFSRSSIHLLIFLDYYLQFGDHRHSIERNIRKYLFMVVKISDLQSSMQTMSLHRKYQSDCPRNDMKFLPICVMHFLSISYRPELLFFGPFVPLRVYFVFFFVRIFFWLTALFRLHSKADDHGLVLNKFTAYNRWVFFSQNWTEFVGYTYNCVFLCHIVFDIKCFYQRFSRFRGFKIVYFLFFAKLYCKKDYWHVDETTVIVPEPCPPFGKVRATNFQASTEILIGGFCTER